MEQETVNIDAWGLIQPERITITGADNIARDFIIGQVPYMSGGRRLLAEFVPSGLPKIGDYEKNEDLAKIMFAHVVAIDACGKCWPLKDPAQIDNRVTDVLTAVKLEAAVFDKATSFLITGGVRDCRLAWQQIVEHLSVNLPTELQQLVSGLASALSKTSEKG